MCPVEPTVSLAACGAVCQCDTGSAMPPPDLTSFVEGLKLERNLINARPLYYGLCFRRHTLNLSLSPITPVFASKVRVEK